MTRNFGRVKKNEERVTRNGGRVKKNEERRPKICGEMKKEGPTMVNSSEKMRKWTRTCEYW